MHLIEGEPDCRFWVVVNDCYLVVCALLALGGCAFMFCLMSCGEKVLIQYIPSILFILCMGWAMLDASWRNGRYELRDTGIVCKYMLSRGSVLWSEICSAGIFPIHTVAHSETHYYIVLFLTGRRPLFPCTLSYCSIHRRKMILVRASKERVDEISTALEAHHIPWLGQQEYKFAH